MTEPLTLAQRLRGIPVNWIDTRLGNEAADRIEADAATITRLAEANKALTADNEELSVKYSGAVERGLSLVAAKNYWHDKFRAAEAERDRLREALKERAAWHKCSCPEPCDDYNVFPGGCAGRYAADYLALQKEPQP
jgi:hypothetical protein